MAAASALLGAENTNPLSITGIGRGFDFCPSVLYHDPIMEFAVIQTGGKQYPVAVGDRVKIEKLPGELKEGDNVIFDSVLLVEDGSDTTIGTPFIEGAAVHGTIEKIGRAKKVDVVKYKAKSRYFKRRGHRQPFMEVKITSLGERVEGGK